MASIGSLYATLRLDSSQYDRALTASGRRTVTIAAAIRKELASVATRFVAPAAAIAGIATITTKAAAMADQFQNLARRIDGSFEGVQVLGRLARDFGGDAGIFTQGLDGLNRKLAEARAGSEQAAEPFHRLGLSLRQFEGLAAERKLELIARAAANAADKNGAFLAVSELLGTSATPKLQAALERLATDGYDHLADRARRAGLVMNDDTAQRLIAAKRTFEDVGHALLLFGARAADGLIKAANAAADYSSKLQDPTGGARNTNDDRVAAIFRAPRAVSNEAERQQLLADFQREAASLRAHLNAQDLSDLDRRTPLSAADIEGRRGQQKVLDEYLIAIEQLNDASMQGVMLRNQEAAAAKRALEDAQRRAIAEEEAQRWLKANRDRLVQQNTAAAELMETDERRLELLRERLAIVEQEKATLANNKGNLSAAEIEKTRLQLDERRLDLLKEIRPLEEAVADAAASGAKAAKDTANFYRGAANWSGVLLLNLREIDRGNAQQKVAQVLEGIAGAEAQGRGNIARSAQRALDRADQQSARGDIGAAQDSFRRATELVGGIRAPTLTDAIVAGGPAGVADRQWMADLPNYGLSPSAADRFRSDYMSQNRGRAIGDTELRFAARSRYAAADAALAGVPHGDAMGGSAAGPTDLVGAVTELVEALGKQTKEIAKVAKKLVIA